MKKHRQRENDPAAGAYCFKQSEQLIVKQVEKVMPFRYNRRRKLLEKRSVTRCRNKRKNREE